MQFFQKAIAARHYVTLGKGCTILWFWFYLQWIKKIRQLLNLHQHLQLHMGIKLYLLLHKTWVTVNSKIIPGTEDTLLFWNPICPLVRWCLEYDDFLNVKIEFPHDAVVLFFVIYSPNMKILNLKRYFDNYIHCSALYNSQDIKTTKMPNNR